MGASLAGVRFQRLLSMRNNSDACGEYADLDNT